MGLTIVPPLTSVMYEWLTKRSRFEIIDYMVLFLAGLGMVGSGSKGVILPFLFSYIGVASFLGKEIFSQLRVWVVLAVVVGVSSWILTNFFPLLGFFDILELIVFRIAANTDSVEYLIESEVHPGEFPYAGFGALVPMLFKPLGYNFEYPAGVWLHGIRYGDWSGFGPNSGIVMDYFANLGWFGLFGAAFLGLYMRFCHRLGGVVGCAFLSIANLMVFDVALFDIPFGFWLVIATALGYYRYIFVRKFVPDWK